MTPLNSLHEVGDHWLMQVALGEEMGRGGQGPVGEKRLVTVNWDVRKDTGREIRYEMRLWKQSGIRKCLGWFAIIF